MNRFLPNQYQSGVDRVNLASLKKLGKSGLLVDIDNTLCKDNAMKAEPFAASFIRRAKAEGFSVCLMSNNGQARVEPIGKILDCPALYKAGKPGRAAYEKAAGMIGKTTAECVMIGDQLFTDIYGGNRAGMYTVLVRPIDPEEIFQIRLKRPFEKIILFFNRKKWKE